MAFYAKAMSPATLDAAGAGAVFSTYFSRFISR